MSVKGTGGSVEVSGMDSENIQGSNHEHKSHANLFLPVHFQDMQLRQRNGQHPKVQSYADTGVYPSDEVSIQTKPLVLAIPAFPKEANGLAYERGETYKSDGIGAVQRDGSPEQASYGPCWENAQVEEQQRRLDRRNCCYVTDLKNEQVLCELRDVALTQGPDIAAQSMADGAQTGEEDARDAKEYGCQDEPVIRAYGTQAAGAGPLAHEDFDVEPDTDSDEGEKEEYSRRNDQLGLAVAHRHAARPVAHAHSGEGILDATAGENARRHLGLELVALAYACLVEACERTWRRGRGKNGDEAWQLRVNESMMEKVRRRDVGRMTYRAGGKLGQQRCRIGGR